MNYDTLCLSGGGLKGGIFFGILQYLQNKNLFDLSKINTFVGTSIGALFSFALNLGYTIQDNINFFLYFDFKLLMSEFDIDNFLENVGANDGERVVFLLKYFLRKKLDRDDITFKELFDITNKNLIIIVCNYTKGCEEILNYKTTPNLSVILAVRMSISIPIIFSPVFYNDCYYIDGGVINNFPINYCNYKTTLGLVITNQFENELDGFKKLIHNSFTILFNSNTNKNIFKNSLNIIKINNVDRETLNFEIDFNYKASFIKTGIRYARKFIKDLPYNISNHIIDDIIYNVLNNYKSNSYTQTIISSFDKYTQTDFDKYTQTD